MADIKAAVPLKDETKCEDSGLDAQVSSFVRDYFKPIRTHYSNIAKVAATLCQNLFMKMGTVSWRATMFGLNFIQR